jgi:acetolactate synthase-1/2/3 large subunit
VIGDIANAIWQIDEAVNEVSHWDFTRVMTIREANEAQIAEGADDDRFQSIRSDWWPIFVVSAV